jgi:hypothetical protein
MKRSWFAMIVVLGLLIGTGGRASGQPPAGSAPAPSRFTLRITFSGLIAFAQDDDKRVWAFLPKADTVDKNNPETLPPGIVKELDAANTFNLGKGLPRHRAWIRFRNASVTSGNAGDPKKGRPIAGDVRFVTDLAGPVKKADLSKLADAPHVRQAFTSLNLPAAASAQLAELDELDPVFLDPPLDPHLAARARVDAGVVFARTLDECPGLPRYSFDSGLGDECNKGTKQDAVHLAEEVVATQDGLTGKVTVEVDRESIALEPKDRSQPLVIEVLNDIDQAIDNPDLSPCTRDTLHEHPHVFRWFYRLSPGTVQQDTAEQFFPCLKVVNQGPPKCPQKAFIVKKKGKQ